MVLLQIFYPQLFSKETRGAGDTSYRRWLGVSTTLKLSPVKDFQYDRARALN